MNRREFLKGIGAFLAGLFAPKVKKAEAPPAVSTYDILGDFNEFVIARENTPQWVTCQCGSQYWTGGDDAGVRCSNCGSPPEMSCFVDLAHD